MLDQFKAMGAVAGLMKNKEKLREVGERFQATLERINVTGSSGGGAVRVSVSGKLRVTDVHLDSAMIAGLGTGEGGRAMAQALVAEAANDALQRAQAVIREEADRLARELGLPELPGMDRLLG